MIGTHFDRGYGHFTTRQNLQFNWVKLVDVPEILARPRRRRDALHPDERQLRAQRHRRSFRRRRQRRARGPAPLVRDPAPMVDAASGVQLAAAQVQDRRLRRGRGSRRDRLPRHRPAHRARARGQQRLPRVSSAAAWAARPMSARRSGRSSEAAPALLHRVDPARVQSATAAATTSTRRASRSWSTSSASTNSARMSRPIGRRRRKDAVDLPSVEICPHQLLFRPARSRAWSASKTRASSSGRITDPAFANWLKHNVRPHRVPGYVSVVISLKEPGRTPGDASSDQMDFVADLAERYSLNEARVNYTQNLILPHVARATCSPSMTSSSRRGSPPAITISWAT